MWAHMTYILNIWTIRGLISRSSVSSSRRSARTGLHIGEIRPGCIRGNHFHTHHR